MSHDQLRSLPSVDLLASRIREDDPAITHAAAVEAARSVVAEIRAAVLAGQPMPEPAQVAARATGNARASATPLLRRVINATGVILQTNLGRAPLSERALAAIAGIGAGYSSLEYDVERGQRGSRHDHVRAFVRRATGAEDAIAVNNNASALFMVLTVFATGREVIVSRGEAVEIGGGFRIPDVLRQSGATLVEVGTTNRTYVRDYERAITGNTAALLRVHASNFRVVGFTARPDPREMAALARSRGVLLLDDLGSGCLLETRVYGMEHEPTVQESLGSGADLALFSGDKLLGGPQCGIIAGRTELVEQLRRHPLARALRVDKLTIAALNATLQSYVDGRAEQEIPVWRMIAAPVEEIRERASRWAEAAGKCGSVTPARSMVGGGSLPGEGVPTWCAAISPEGSPSALAERLRRNKPPIIARIEDGRVLLDPRTVERGDDDMVAESLLAATRAQSDS